MPDTPHTVPDSLRFRQVHLDFHTSPAIPEVAADFDPEDFARTLERARVDSVTCFARCHHGLIYYASAQNPERVHPQLAHKDLLGAQIAACHARGIRVPIYTTIQWDAFTADAQRDWLCLDEQGREVGTLPLEPGFYRNLDVFHPGYRQFLQDHVGELLETFPCDGFFFDIVKPSPSLAAHWLTAMDEANLNPEDPAQRRAFAGRVIDDWKLEMTAFVRQHNPHCTVFYNAGHIGPRQRSSQAAYSHYELESLPSGGWGYMHFPLAMRYARTLGRECLGMTGKFHTSWGDFGSYKNEAALQFECFHMLALGAKCSVGDQLHPSGQLDPHTYRLIGSVYGEVEAKEPWCREVTSVSEVGVLTPEAFVGQPGGPPLDSPRVLPSAMGAVRMLQELRVQFDLLDDLHDLAPYKLLILPDEIPVDRALAARLGHYLAAGGSLIASYRAGLRPQGDGFASEHFGVTFKGEAPYSPDFIVPDEDFGGEMRAVAQVMYRRGLEVKAAPDAVVLAQVEVPYFNRTWQHYCSHLHTPSSGQVGYPGVVQRGRVIYFAHPVFSQYQENAPRWCKQLVAGALERLLPKPMVEVTGPSTLLATLNHQPHQGRYVLHLLHYIPERRGAAFEVLEDVIPLYNTEVRVRLPVHVTAVTRVPAGGALEFDDSGGQVRFTVPKLEGHQMLELRVA